MKFSLSKSTEILNATPSILEKQLTGLSIDWLMQNEGGETWTPAEIVCHLVHCEEDDWVTRMKIILSDSENKTFTPFNRTEGFDKSKSQTIDELIKEFRELRKKNLDYLNSLKLNENDLNKKGTHPDFGEVTLRQLLSTWVVHDLSHIAQINRVLANQYNDEVGPWIEFLPILKKQISPDEHITGKDQEFDWSSYYKHKPNTVPRETLTKALELFENEKREGQLFAIDIGSGHGSDTLELLKNGWKVLAIDNDEEGLRILEESVLPSFRRSFRKVKMAFEEMKLGKCNLLNASYCIPFCKPEFFKRLWHEIDNSILKDGRFSGNFFGKHDTWANNKNMTFHTTQEVRKLFENFKIEYFHERDEDGQTADGVSKHWHVYSVIAKKI